MFALFLFSVPTIKAGQLWPEAMPTPLSWTSAPDDRPGAFFRGPHVDVKGRLDCIAMAKLGNDDPVPDRNPFGPTLPFGWGMNRPDFFATAFLAAHERPWPAAPQARAQQVDDPFNEDGQLFAPPRPPSDPSIFADTPMSVVFFGVGIVGWIAFGVIALFLEQRRPA